MKRNAAAFYEVVNLEIRNTKSELKTLQQAAGNLRP